MSRGARGRLQEAMETALCFGLGPSDRPRRESGRRSAARPDRGGVHTRTTVATRIYQAPPDPLAGEDFRTLRELRDAFGRGGLPASSDRTATEEARITVFFVLQELLHLLGQYRRAVERGERPRLVVSEHGRQLRKIVLEVRIEAEPT